MDTKKLIYRISFVVVCAIIGYWLYELVVGFLSPELSVIQIPMAVVITGLLLLVLVPLASFLLRGDDKGILMVLIFIGSLTIAGFGFYAADFLRPHLDSLPGLIGVVFGIISLIAPFYLAIGFRRWASRKYLVRFSE